MSLGKDSDKGDFLANDFHTTITNTSPSLSESSKIEELKLRIRALTEVYVNGKIDYQTYINETAKLSNEIENLKESRNRKIEYLAVQLYNIIKEDMSLNTDWDHTSEFIKKRFSEYAEKLLNVLEVL
jgi:hypothetical protein